MVSATLDGVQLTTATGPTSASLSAGAAVFVSGTANAVTGQLGVAASASNAAKGSPPPPTFIQSRFSEVITFTSGFGQTAYLDFTFRGSLPDFGYTGSSGLQATFATLEVFSGFVRGGAALNRDGTAECTSDTQICLSGTTADVIGSLPFVIGSQPINLGATLFARSGEAIGGSYANFSIGNAIYLRTEASWTSQSGLFLTQAAPISAPIPEPSSFVLMLIGAMGLWSARRGVSSSAS